MDELRQLAESILAQGFLISLGTADDGGVWVADVSYVHDQDLNLYWLSSPSVRHSQAIARNPQVAGTVTVGTREPREANACLQIAGQAAEVAESLEIAQAYAAKRFKPLPQKVGELAGPTQRWYKLTPQFIDVIYETKFGRNKPKITF